MKKIQATIFSDNTPTATENIANGYALGQWWQINGTGEKYYHKTDGVWVELKTSQSVNLRTIDKFYHGVVATGQAVKCQSRYVITGAGTTYIYTLASDGTIDSTVAPRTVATAGGLFVTYIPTIDEFWVINATTSIYRISATADTLTATITIATGTSRFSVYYANGYYYYNADGPTGMHRITVSTQSIETFGSAISGYNPIAYTYGGTNYVAHTINTTQFVIRLESDFSLVNTVTFSSVVTASRQLTFYNDKIYISNGNTISLANFTTQNATGVYDIATESLSILNNGLVCGIGFESYMIGLGVGQNNNRLIKVIDYTGAVIATVYNQDQYPTTFVGLFIYCPTTKMIYYRGSSNTANANNLTLMKI